MDVDRGNNSPAGRASPMSSPEESLPDQKQLLGEEYLRAIFEAAPIGISLTNVHGTIVAGNPQLHALLGYGPGELLGIHFSRFTHPDDLEPDLTLLAEMLAGKRSGYTLEKRYIRKDGATIRVRLSVTMAHPAEGSAPLLMAMTEDITAARLAEDALRDSEERYRTVIETSPECIIVTDLSGSIVMANQRTAELHGYERADAMSGLSLLELAAPEERERAAVDMVSLLTGGNFGGREYLLLRRDGSTFYSEIEAALIPDREGRPALLLAIGRDLTERKRANEELRRQLITIQALQSERDHAFASAAHDLRSPLTAIHGYAQMLRRRLDLGEASPAVLEETIDKMDTSVLRMMELIDQALEPTRREPGQMPAFEFRQEKIGALLLSVLLEAQAAHAGKPFMVMLGREEMLVRLDRAQFVRVMVNVLDNAAKFSPPDSQVDLSMHRDGEWVVITVADSGCGIPAADLQHIFDRFHRGSNVAGIEGSGIGLASAREIIESHGGTIEVASEEGQGTTVTVRLPISPSADTTRSGG
jgi:PAS domain S-box-containing protein